MRLFISRWAQTSKSKVEELKVTHIPPDFLLLHLKKFWAHPPLEWTELFYKLLHIHVCMSQCSCSLSAELGDKPISSEQRLSTSLCQHHAFLIHPYFRLISINLKASWSKLLVLYFLAFVSAYELQQLIHMWLWQKYLPSQTMPWMSLLGKGFFFHM